MSSNSLTRRMFWVAGSLFVAITCTGILPARARPAPKAAFDQNATYAPGTFVSGQLEVMMAAGAPIDPVVAALNATDAKLIAYSKSTYLVHAPIADGAMRAAVQTVAGIPGVVAVSASRHVSAQALPLTRANDQFAQKQWSMIRTHVPEAQKIIIG